jgi:hypothetical protein
MGLLDDAIREHLELRRQHGADPEEVSRQEREALGAARKAEFAKAESDEAAEERPDVETEPAAEAEAAEQPEAEEPVAAEPEPVEQEPEPVAPEPAGGAPFDVESAEPPPEPEGAKPGYDEDPWLEDERDEVPAGESLDHPRAPEEAKEEGEEDVLEETPDFLQETPEHDRLWFEQRPPRDFDWDK